MCEFLLHLVDLSRCVPSHRLPIGLCVSSYSTSSRSITLCSLSYATDRAMCEFLLHLVDLSRCVPSHRLPIGLCVSSYSTSSRSITLCFIS